MALPLYLINARIYYMGKHHDKIAKALEIRQAHMPKGNGFKKPGSMNKKKTGYRGQKANGSK